MAEYIEREAAIAIIEKKQKELCPVGRYGRGCVYGLDREKYDAWDEIIDALENVPAVDVAPVVHGRWEVIEVLTDDIQTAARCNICGELISWFGKFSVYCPNCGAKMDGGADHE